MELRGGFWSLELRLGLHLGGQGVGCSKGKRMQNWRGHRRKEGDERGRLTPSILAVLSGNDRESRKTLADSMLKLTEWYRTKELVSSAAKVAYNETSHSIIGD